MIDIKPKYEFVKRHEGDRNLDQWQVSYCGYTFKDIRPGVMNSDDHDRVLRLCVKNSTEVKDQIWLYKEMAKRSRICLGSLRTVKIDYKLIVGEEPDDLMDPWDMVVHIAENY